MTVTIERAREVFNLLTDIRVEAAIAAGPAGLPEATADAGALLADLFALIRDADLVPDVETHLQTVCEMTLRYVEACTSPLLRSPAWTISTRNHAQLGRATREIFGRGAPTDPSKPDRRHMVGYRLTDIVWDAEHTILRTLPSTVFLSSREVRLAIAYADMEMADAVDAAFEARHPVRALSYEIGQPTSNDVEDADPPTG